MNILHTYYVLIIYYFKTKKNPTKTNKDNAKLFCTQKKGRPGYNENERNTCGYLRKTKTNPAHADTHRRRDNGKIFQTRKTENISKEIKRSELQTGTKKDTQYPAHVP